METTQKYDTSMEDMNLHKTEISKILLSPFDNIVGTNYDGPALNFMSEIGIVNEDGIITENGYQLAGIYSRLYERSSKF